MPEYKQPNRKPGAKQIPLPSEEPKPLVRKNAEKTKSRFTDNNKAKNSTHIQNKVKSPVAEKKKSASSATALMAEKKAEKKLPALSSASPSPQRKAESSAPARKPSEKSVKPAIEKKQADAPAFPYGKPTAAKSGTSAARTSAKTPTKKRKRKGSYTLYYIVFAVLAIIIMSVLSVTVLFNIGNITIEGESIYSEEKILEAGGVGKGDNLVRMNTNDLEKRILEQLVCLDSVKISKNFPDGLTITVEGAAEYLSVYDNGKYYVTSAKNRVLEITSSPKNCVTVYGFEPVEAAVGEHLVSTNENKTNLASQLVTALNEAEIGKIVDINITDRQSITVNYDNRITLKLGNSTDLAEKFSIAKTLIEREIPTNQKVELDISDTQKVTQRTLSETVTTTEATEATSDSADSSQTQKKPETTKAPEQTTTAPETTTAQTTSAPETGEVTTAPIVTTAEESITAATTLADYGGTSDIQE